jgi:hypothetical protein
VGRFEYISAPFHTERGAHLHGERAIFQLLLVQALRRSRLVPANTHAGVNLAMVTSNEVEPNSIAGEARPFTFIEASEVGSEPPGRRQCGIAVAPIFGYSRA